MPPQNEKESLLPMTANRAFEVLFNELDASIRNAASKENNALILAISNTCAVFSGALYFDSGGPAAARYFGNLAGFFWYALAIRSANAITNALFNAECFQNIIDHLRGIHSKSSKAEEYLTGVSTLQSAIEWVIATGAGTAVVAPIWYLGLGTSALLNTVTGFGAAFNIPVNADGAKSIINWGKSFDCKDRMVDYTCSFFSAKANEDRNKHIALRNARNLLVTHLD
jgi:hypothetical protein